MDDLQRWAENSATSRGWSVERVAGSMSLFRVRVWDLDNPGDITGEGEAMSITWAAVRALDDLSKRLSEAAEV